MIVGQKDRPVKDDLGKEKGDLGVTKGDSEVTKAE